MKSIEEMSIEDLLYRVRYSILPCYGQEILSRFAEQERLIGKLQVQLAGCGVAADQNTEESIKNRITPDNEYYSASYQSVCNAVDREIALRKRIAELEKENEDYKFVMNTNNSNYIYDLKRRIAELEKGNNDLKSHAMLILIDKIAELEKENNKLRFKKEWYHEEHAKELINRTELEKQVADLRCCGNCVHYAYDMEEDHHYCDKHIYSGLRHQGICTNNWQSDNKTKAEREK